MRTLRRKTRVSMRSLTLGRGSIFVVTDAAHIHQIEALTDRLLKQHNPTPLGRWQLEHRLLRSTDAPATTDPKAQPRCQDFLTLSHHGGRAFVAIDGAAPTSSSNSTDTGTSAGARIADAVIAVPVTQRDALFALVENKMAALWTTRMRLGVPSGGAYDAGAYVVRLGELKQMAAQATMRAIVACVQSAASEVSGGASATTATAKSNGDAANGADEQGNNMKTKEAVRSFWKSFGVDGAKEYFYIPTENDDGFGEVRLWCEVLRLRP